MPSVSMLLVISFERATLRSPRQPSLHHGKRGESRSQAVSSGRLTHVSSSLRQVAAPKPARSKMPLEKGYSQMEWMRLSKTTDLAGWIPPLAPFAARSCSERLCCFCVLSPHMQLEFDNARPRKNDSGFDGIQVATCGA